MQKINVEGLPAPIIQALQHLTDQIRHHLAPPPGQASTAEDLKQSFGAWADADEDEFRRWQEETERSREQPREEPSQ